MTAFDKLTMLLVAHAARRWPGDMAREWQAELAAMRGEPPLRRLRFAISLAVSPADLSADPLPRLESWGRSLAGAAGVTLLAGALVNAAHLVQHHAGTLEAAGVWLLAAVLIIHIGRRSHASVLARTLTIGAALFGFLLAGNRVAVMPFMGWRDILPAVLTWTFCTTLLAYAVSHARRRAPALLLAVLGGLLALDLTAMAGSLRAAAGLGVGLTSAPAWFPLAMLPGGTVTFGSPVAVVGLPGFHASEVLLANTAAMIGPMLLSSLFVLTRALTPPWVHTSSVRTFPLFRVRLDSRTVWGVTAAIAALAAGEAFRRTPPGSFEATWHRLLDNSAVFGFGFLADTSGRVVTALIAGLIATHLGVTRRATPN